VQIVLGFFGLEGEEAAGEHKDQLQQMTVIDGLTQVADRRRFDEYLRQEWGRAIGGQLPLSLLICDLDHFKPYNDH
jgi:diguanylate cyclase (GGDEF)-like protein